MCCPEPARSIPRPAGHRASQLVLPVAVLAIYDAGYVARMVRSSMTEVMARPYIRTAVLKGLPRRKVILRHALRNAMIAPFTVILLQINWLIGGVVVTETGVRLSRLRPHAAGGVAVRRHLADRGGDADRARHRHGTQLPAISAIGCSTRRCADEAARPSVPRPMPAPPLAAASRRGNETSRAGSAAPPAQLAVAMVGLGIMLFWVLLALLAPILPLPSPNAQDYLAIGPARTPARHLLGVDPLGRDMLSRLIWGARTVLALAPIAVVVAYAVGLARWVCWPAIIRGWVDTPDQPRLRRDPGLPGGRALCDPDRQYRRRRRSTSSSPS